MAYSGAAKSSDFGKTVEKLREICPESNSEELLYLAAGQHFLNVKFHDLIDDSKSGTFLCSVEVGGLLEEQECIGFGPSKEEAKVNAAHEAITELTSRFKDLSSALTQSTNSTSAEYGEASSSRSNPYPLRSRITPRSNSHSAVTQTSDQKSVSKWMESVLSDSAYEPSRLASPNRLFSSRHSPSLLSSNQTNPIGALQELADTNRWDKPVYDEVDEYGEDHKKTFVIQCKFRNKLTEGIAPNKKAAKKQAAEEMLKLLTEQNGSAVAPISSRVKSTTSQNQRVNSHVTSTSRSSQRRLFADTDSDKDHFRKRLKRITSTKGWTVQWHDIGNGYKNGHLCFVRIQSDPVTVCSGLGLSIELAYEDAARNALKIFNHPRKVVES